MTNVYMDPCLLTPSFSKHAFIADGRPGTLPDGSPSQADFADSLLNRFRVGTQRHRTARPARIVHFYNAPPSATSDKVTAVQNFALFLRSRSMFGYHSLILSHSLIFSRCPAVLG